MKRRNFILTGALASIAGILKPGSGNSKNSFGKNSILEEAKEIPVKGVFDVVVCGGGPAGFAAAVSAARNGASVKLIELQGFLGGVWTAGLMTHFIDAENKAGIMRELLEAQKNANVLKQRYFDVELTKLWLEKSAMEAGVKMLYHTRVVDAHIKDKTLKTIITENSNGREAWQAKIFIDATGNGDLASYCGCSFDLGHPDSGLTQPMSLNSLITGISLKDLQANKFIDAPGLSWAEPRTNLLKEIRKAGADCSYEKPTFFPIREDFFSLMSNHEYNVSSMDAEEITYATIHARQEINEQINALRTLGGIWKNIRLVGTADQIGIRESRRIHGRYTITKDDLINGRHFQDAVCRVTFHVDIHALNPSKNKSIEKHPFNTKSYDIPVRSLIAKEINGLMMAGRCISGDFFAHASYRVTGNAVAMGEAAGVVAARAAKAGILPHQVEWNGN